MTTSHPPPLRTPDPLWHAWELKKRKGALGEKATLQIPTAALTSSSCFFCSILPLGAGLGEEEEEEETMMGRWKLFLLLF